MRTGATHGPDRFLLPPWRLRTGELLPMAATRALPKVAVPPPSNYSEEALWEHSMRARAAELEPPAVPRFPIGTWCAIGDDHMLYHLREYLLDDPALVFLEGLQPNLLSAKYASWIADGSEPPPGKARELEDGRVSVSDGHHRAIALGQAGRRAIQLWVSPVVGRPNQFDANLTTFVGLTHRDAVRAAIEAGHEVPDEVLADYPDLRMGRSLPAEAARGGIRNQPVPSADLVARRREERLQGVVSADGAPGVPQPIDDGLRAPGMRP
jgi:hypothetical protein